jgi:hypothetical protein
MAAALTMAQAVHASDKMYACLTITCGIPTACSQTLYPTSPHPVALFPEIVHLLELFLNKESDRLSSKKAMEGAYRWGCTSETTVR